MLFILIHVSLGRLSSDNISSPYDDRLERGAGEEGGRSRNRYFIRGNEYENNI